MFDTLLKKSLLAITFNTMVMIGNAKSLTDEELMSQPDVLCSNYIAYENSVKAYNKLCGGEYSFPILSNPPKGYKPFYISHYGRHGSRYHYSQDDYKYIFDLMNKAHTDKALTPFGETLWADIVKIGSDADNRAGDLTPIGKSQHKGIATRMMEHFPSVFNGDNYKIDAKSTAVVRCVLSMDAFCDEIQKKYPTINLTTDASKSYQKFLCPGKEVGDGLKRDKTEGKIGAFYTRREYKGTMFERIFKNKNYVIANVNCETFIRAVYYLVITMQGVDVDDMDERNCSLNNIFEAKEMMAQWQKQNLYWYKDNASSHLEGVDCIKHARFMAEKIVQEANLALRDTSIRANLKFGHDGGLLPLVAFLNLSGYGEEYNDLETLHNHWQDFAVVPMAANLQIVFYKNESGNIIVRFILNERDVNLPINSIDGYSYFYDWKDVEKYIYDKIAKFNN